MQRTQLRIFQQWATLSVWYFSAKHYLGGGIAPRIIEKLKGPAFMEAFIDKGRMRDLLREMPVRVIMNDQAAMLGAARCTAVQAGLL